MLPRFFILVSVTLLTTSINAFASDRLFSGAELATQCTSKSDLDFGFCAGYLTAVADQLTKGPVGEYRACNLDKVRSQQLIDIYVSYADLFPDMTKEPANIAAAAALARAFPCTTDR